MEDPIHQQILALTDLLINDSLSSYDILNITQAIANLANALNALKN